MERDFELEKIAAETGLSYGMRIDECHAILSIAIFSSFHRFMFIQSGSWRHASKTSLLEK